MDNGESGLINRLFEFCGVDTLTELAVRTGVPYNTLKNYTEAGGRMPSSEVLLQIARATGIDLNWLLGLPHLETKEAGGRKIHLDIPAIRITLSYEE